MQYRVEIKEGLHHEGHLGGEIIDVSQSAYDAFKDKFKLIGVDEPTEEYIEEVAPEERYTQHPSWVAPIMKKYNLGDPSKISTLTDEEILSVRGIGEATLARIRGE